MTQKLTDFLNKNDSKKHATKNGTKAHILMQNVVVDDVCGNHGAHEIIKKIQKMPHLRKYFSHNAVTEIPIAGFVNGIFISRRIDRLLINHISKTIEFIDYKTDINKHEFIEKYKKQLSEYEQLLRSAYPEYKIVGYILWLHNWELEQII